MAFPAMAAEAFYFLLDQKVTKNQVSKEASLRSLPLPAKLIKLRARSFCRRLCRNPSLQEKLPMPLPYHSPIKFYQFLPEAFLLALVHKNCILHSYKSVLSYKS